MTRTDNQGRSQIGCNRFARRNNTHLHLVHRLLHRKAHASRFLDWYRCSLDRFHRKPELNEDSWVMKDERRRRMELVRVSFGLRELKKLTSHCIVTQRVIHLSICER